MTLVINTNDCHHDNSAAHERYLPIISTIKQPKRMISDSRVHSFHIPVLGLGYSIDTPIKVARFGISSVISIMDDHLVEKMRAYHSAQSGEPYHPIREKEEDHRAMRITAYLDLVNKIVTQQIEHVRQMAFAEGTDLVKYFELLPDASNLKKAYAEMCALPEGNEKRLLQLKLRNSVVAGQIDVNIMSKIDRAYTDKDGNPRPVEYSDALAALRGFAQSTLTSSVVFSAGYNPRLYNYVEQFADFFPDQYGQLKKKIILKVSDFRSAQIQGKIFAKKGLWVSEFRIESGLNCGGHAFPTDGLLLGPILEEFRNKRAELANELFELTNAANAEKNHHVFSEMPKLKITVQGGIGTANEDRFLLDHFGMDGTGWGSPFLLVPEATNVDPYTLDELANAKKEDYYLSYASPLGIAFNNFKGSTTHKQKTDRIEKGRPGSPCYKKFLASDTEFTETPICTASREYQNLKIKQLEERNLPEDEYKTEFEKITEKDCLCEGLGSAALLKDNIPLSHNLAAVTICPGPNLAYFTGKFSLAQMVNHIYGRTNLLNSLSRPNMFINELQLYITYFKEKSEQGFGLNPKQAKYLDTLKKNLLQGIDYYNEMVQFIKNESDQYIASTKAELEAAIGALSAITSNLVLAAAHEQHS